jgi:hypothetical protein
MSKHQGGDQLPEIARALRETWKSAVRQVRLAESALATARQSLAAAQAKADEVKRQLEVAAAALGLDPADLLAVDQPAHDLTAPNGSGPAVAVDGGGARLTYAEQITDLLSDGRLIAGEQLRAVQHGQEHFARLEANGFITGSFGSKRSLSAAARTLAGGERNGWKFWTVLRDGRWLPLADLRRG